MRSNRSPDHQTSPRASMMGQYSPGIQLCHRVFTLPRQGKRTVRSGPARHDLRLTAQARGAHIRCPAAGCSTCLRSELDTRHHAGLRAHRSRKQTQPLSGKAMANPSWKCTARSCPLIVEDCGLKLLLTNSPIAADFASASQAVGSPRHDHGHRRLTVKLGCNCSRRSLLNKLGPATGPGRSAGWQFRKDV